MRLLQYSLHVKAAGTVVWYFLPSTGTGARWRCAGEPKQPKGPHPRGPHVAESGPAPPSDVTRPRAAPPPGAAPLTGCLGLTILTPSAEPMAGIAGNSCARVARCRQQYRPITAPRRRGGSPHKPITAGEADLDSRLHPEPEKVGFRTLHLPGCRCR